MRTGLTRNLYFIKSSHILTNRYLLFVLYISHNYYIGLTKYKNLIINRMHYINRHNILHFIILIPLKETRQLMNLNSPFARVHIQRRVNHALIY